jgi:hypothetical protein
MGHAYAAPALGDATDASFPVQPVDENAVEGRPGPQMGTRDQVLPAKPAAEAGSVVVKMTATKRSRSDELVDCLRAQRLGPYSRIRRGLFDVLENVVKDKAVAAKGFSSVLSTAIDRAKEAMPDGPACKPIPWRGVKVFLRDMLLRRPVLVAADDVRIGSGFGTLTIPVVGLVADWKLELDGELVIALVRSGVRLHLSDPPNIAGALFNDRSSEAEAMAGEVIDFLIETGRLQESKEHFLVEASSDRLENKVLEGHFNQPEATLTSNGP